MSDNDQPKSENELTKLIAAKVDELIEEIRPMLKVALTEVGIATIDTVAKAQMAAKIETGGTRR